MYRAVLGDDAENAFALTYSRDPCRINDVFPALSKSTNKPALCSLLREQMAIACLYDLYEHARQAKWIPDWLELKCRLLHKLSLLENPDECGKFLDGRPLSECLADDEDDML